MKNKISKGGFRVVFAVIGFCLLVSVVVKYSERVSSQQNGPAMKDTSSLLATETNTPAPEPETGILEKMIVANGNASIDIDLNRLNGTKTRTRNSTLSFTLVPDSFFTVLVFNGQLRGPLPSTMGFVPQSSPLLPTKLNASYHQLVLESTPWGGDYELVIRDINTGFIFFNIEGHTYGYDPDQHLLTVQEGRVLMSKEFATEIGRPAEAGTVVGNISINATMRDIEVTRLIEGEVVSDILPAAKHSGKQSEQPVAGTRPGPDVVVGDLNGLAQFGSSSGTQVGLAVGTDSCNFGVVDLDWFALPDNDHPVIPQNLYRMSGGTTNDERFEQIGQSSVKHAFTALTNNICGLNCNGVGGTHLGSGCSDPYVASLNSGNSNNNLGSRAWINPFTGSYPRGDSATPPNTHTGHSHSGPSHRILTESADLNTTLNPGASYYAEGQYITPHEYVWCQANPTQCNMNNNVSHRRYTVTGTACASGTSNCYSFSAAAATVREKTAISAWTGSASLQIQPAPGVDGIGTVAYKVTNPSAGVWHYEYAVYNQNLDRAIQSFSVPVGGGATVSNIGFHAPPQHPGWAADGTGGNAGFSSTPWAQSQANGAMTWNSETFAQNQNANAIRWGTLYNFRFDSNRPPENKTAIVGFYKTGAPINVTIQGPSAALFAISGRVVSPTGRGIRGTTVSMTDPFGAVRTAVTNSFGYYQFTNVTAGQSYNLNVTSRRFTFATKAVSVTADMLNQDIIGQ